MARVTHVKKAQKSKSARRCTKCGTEIKVGDPYKWFANRIGRMSIRKNFCVSCPIRQSDQTTSGNLQTLYGAIEAAEDEMAAAVELTLGDGSQILEAAAEGVREAASMYEESADNMESGFGHETSMSEEIREKQNDLEAFADELESAANEIESLDDPEEDEASIMVGFEGEVDEDGKPLDEDEAAEYVESVRQERREAIETAINDVLYNSPL